MISKIFQKLTVKIPYLWTEYVQILQCIPTVCPSSIYLFEVNNENTKTTCKICSKLIMRTPVITTFLLLTLNRFRTLIRFAHCWFEQLKARLAQFFKKGLHHRHWCLSVAFNVYFWWLAVIFTYILQISQKRGSGTSVFLWILQNCRNEFFVEHLWTSSTSSTLLIFWNILVDEILRSGLVS